MDFVQFLKRKARCCITGRSMQSSRHVNLIMLDRICTWDHPYSQNLFIPEDPRHAIAVVHDCTFDKETNSFKGKIIRAVEIKGDQIIYHPVEDLDKIVKADQN